jgi:hypothetical protein
MYSDNIEEISNYIVSSDFSTDGRIVSLLNFLEEHLPEFPNKIKITEDTHEEILNQKLLRFLLSKTSLFWFIAENRNETGESKSKPDFGVYENIEVYDDNQIRFFDIECKRLYHVTKSKQYVSGKTGGIQRFKENKHGVDLSHSAMIGYVENETFSFWHNKVNSWISDVTEHLRMIASQKIVKLVSTHKRQSPQFPTIELTHFWLKMNF